MGLHLRTPSSDELEAITSEVGEWHTDDAPFQLHPGDIGWFGWRGDDVTAAALRTWWRDGQLVAAGLLDGPGLIRLAIAPEAITDPEVAELMAADIAQQVSVPTTLRIEVVDERNAHARTAVHRAAFDSEAFTDERWRSVASTPAYRQARCLVGLDDEVPVAAITVWSAGEGRPGIIEPGSASRPSRTRSRRHGHAGWCCCPA